MVVEMKEQRYPSMILENRSCSTIVEKFQKSEHTVKFPKIWASCESSKKSEYTVKVPKIWVYCESTNNLSILWNFQKSGITVKSIPKNPICLGKLVFNEVQFGPTGREESYGSKIILEANSDTSVVYVVRWPQLLQQWYLFKNRYIDF